MTLRAIELRPDYPESYKLLSFVNMVTNTHLDESVAPAQKVLATSPGRSDLLFILAQVYLHKEDYKTAREMLENLSNGNSEARQSGTGSACPADFPGRTDRTFSGLARSYGAREQLWPSETDATKRQRQAKCGRGQN